MEENHPCFRLLFLSNGKSSTCHLAHAKYKGKLQNYGNPFNNPSSEY
jgi:hypothetical protein